jgi:hypothetical protein
MAHHTEVSAHALPARSAAAMCLDQVVAVRKPWTGVPMVIVCKRMWRLFAHSVITTE